MRDFITLRQAMDQLFEESLVQPRWDEPRRERVARLPLDAYSTEEEIVILASLPGLKPEDVEITIEGDTLSIKGQLCLLTFLSAWSCLSGRIGFEQRGLNT